MGLNLRVRGGRKTRKGANNAAANAAALAAAQAAADNALPSGVVTRRGNQRGDDGGVGVRAKDNAVGGDSAGNSNRSTPQPAGVKSEVKAENDEDM